MKLRPLLLISVTMTLVSVMFSCHNRALHDGEEFRPRKIYSDIEFQFDHIVVDGVDYLILEKDNNNPHEGFGFMAFRANKLIAKSDTLLAYARTSTQLQAEMYAKIMHISQDSALNYTQVLFNYYLKDEQAELDSMEQEGLTSRILNRTGENN